jgi:hypothetical protein
MGAGKVLTIIGSILTLVGIYIFNWVPESMFNMTGINGLMGIPDILDPSFADFLILIGYESWMAYILLIVVILIAISGILSLIGIKAKALSLIGGLIPFAFGGIMIIITLDLFDLGDALNQFFGVLMLLFAGTEPIVEGIIPFNVDFADMTLGPILIAVGGLLALISGFMSRDDF